VTPSQPLLGRLLEAPIFQPSRLIEATIANPLCDAFDLPPTYENENSGVIILNYIHSKKNMADLFTKVQTCNVIHAASKDMGLRPTKAIT
jgi:hypothetical protein